MIFVFLFFHLENVYVILELRSQYASICLITKCNSYVPSMLLILRNNNRITVWSVIPSCSDTFFLYLFSCRTIDSSTTAEGTEGVRPEFTSLPTVDDLLSRMNDLSFMLQDNLSIPSNTKNNDSTS